MEILLIALVLLTIGMSFYAAQQRALVQQHQSRLNAQTQSLNQHNATTTDLQDNVRALTATVDHLRHDLQARDSALNELRSTLVNRENTITGLRADIIDHEGHNNQLQERLVESARVIVELREKLQNHEQTIADLHRQIDSHIRETIQSKALFSTIANVAYDLVFVLDEDTTVIALNKSADSLFGQKNPIGERLSQVLDAPDLQDLVDRALHEEESLEDQLRIETRFYRASTQVMRYNDHHVFIGVALQDITELVRLNRARRDMVANISHELRTPIANIRLIIEGLFHEQDRPKRKASIASLRQIQRETDQLLWLVQELLDLSMIESGQAIMKLVDNALVDIAEQSLLRLTDQLETKNINIVQHIPQRMRVLCDADQTRRVLVNLVHNAIKWSPPNEAITISAEAHGEDVTISVFDNGPGVPDEMRERIFERFYQVDASRSGGEGTGLGLAICKHIVEAHGGQIWAEGNSGGHGGRFRFTLLNAGMNDEDVSPLIDHHSEPRDLGETEAAPIAESTPETDRQAGENDA